jgi:RHS repeat-associated protein
MMKDVITGTCDFQFSYGDNGLLTQRTNPWRTQTVAQRDTLGRITSQVNTVGTITPLSETLAWRNDSKLQSYAAARQGTGSWNDSATYAYNNRGQLLSEPYTDASGQSATFTYAFDGTQSGTGAGVRTLAQIATQQQYAVSATNAFLQVGQEENTLLTSGSDSIGWRYDNVGAVTSRVTTVSGTQQSLSWDTLGNLWKVSTRDLATGLNGCDWIAVYDGLGRRIQTSVQQIVSGTAAGSPTSTTSSIYDPQVEFLEIGIQLNSTLVYKLYGPDLNGSYGGSQGIGGLEAVADTASGVITPVINDRFGNTVGVVSGGSSFEWNPAHAGAYGVLPGYTAPVLESGSFTLAQSTLWRGHRIDSAGFYYMGARYYDPQSGRFLSPDPLGHGASISLYDYANGDPVNGLDPDGRFGKGVIDGWNGTIPANAPNSSSFSAGAMFGGMFNGGGSGAVQGVKNDAAVVGIGFTAFFGGKAAYTGINSITDWAGWTNTSAKTQCEQLQYNTSLSNATGATQDVAFAVAGAFQAPKVGAPIPQTWSGHETAVTQRLITNNPGVTIGVQVTMDVTNVSTGETVTIIADNTVPTSTGVKIVDAKFSTVTDLTDPSVNLSSTVTPNQSKAYGWISSGQPVTITPRGQNAFKAGFTPGVTLPNVSPVVEIHVNTRSGGVAVRTYP